MKRPPAADAIAAPDRRWHIPPPLVHGTAPLEGGAVLDEIPGFVGFVLWQALRDTLLWTETPAGDREELFAPEAGMRRIRSVSAAMLEEPLIAPVMVLGGIVSDPASARAASIAEACARIGQWAERRGALGTALAFAQNAALAQPSSAASALGVARIASRLGDHARAELWYRRCTGVARRSRAWRPYARAFSGLGTLYQDRGNLPAAQRFHLRALRGARRGGLRPERAAALHDLFAVAVEGGRIEEAERYAREALSAYPGRHPRLAALAHDVAYFWMEEGHFARALAVFEAVAPLLRDPAQRLWVDADLMRAAAGAGDSSLARQMATTVRGRCEDPRLRAAAARAQLELARGELHLGNWDAAEAAASEALTLARAHREGRTLLSAEAVLAAVKAGRSAGASAAAHRNFRQSTVADEALAADLIQSLQLLAGAADSNNDGGE